MAGSSLSSNLSSNLSSILSHLSSLSPTARSTFGLRSTFSSPTFALSFSSSSSVFYICAECKLDKSVDCSHTRLPLTLDSLSH